MEDEDPKSEPFLDTLDSDDDEDLPFFDCPASFIQPQPQPQPSSVLHRPSPSQPPSSTTTDHPIKPHTHNGSHNTPAQLQTHHDHGHGHGQFSFHDQEQNIHDHGQFSFLVFLAEFLIKAIAFQFNLLVTLIALPIWALYYSCLFALNPIRSFTRFRHCLVRKLTRLWSHVWKSLAPFVRAWFHEHKALLDLALRCGWGLFWSVYVCCVLVVLLISGFVISGVLMKCYLLQEPFQLKQGLNFDYTKTKPVAFVPITSCPTQLQEWGTQNMTDFGEGDDGGMRVIPLNQDLQASVSLVLPESGYNRHLGIFQESAWEEHLAIWYVHSHLDTEHSRN